MFDTNTQYALNKRTADAIVYVDAFGKRIEVTADGLDAEEFAIWKELLVILLWINILPPSEQRSLLWHCKSPRRLPMHCCEAKTSRR